MCGITGFAGPGDRETLERMLEAIRHRGPDDSGIFLNNEVGLAHARLSIIDLSPTGHQPMFAPDESMALIFNGEIYNFRALREELEKTKKYHFRGTSDTEVIINLYLEFGEKVFEKLNGMFAIALYDFKKSLLILARDRMGKKPLYWSLAGKTLVFASELKGLFAHPQIKKELNLESLNKYLALDYVPTPHSIIKGVEKLEPATYLVFRNGVIRKETFWQPDFSAKEITLDEATSGLDKILSESVKDRLISDVPLGVFLSGGLDSSTVAYYASRAAANRINTFSVRFEDDTFDESHHARGVAKFLGTEHHEETLTERDALYLVPKIADSIDEPLADASFLPTYLLSRFTKESVTVALGGDGADELFAGYPTFQAERFSRLYEKIPKGLRKTLEPLLLKSLPAGDGYLSANFKLKQFLKGAGASPELRHPLWLSSFTKDTRKELLAENVWSRLAGKSEYENALRSWNEIDASENSRALYQYMRTYLMDEVLVKVDRASMAHALEVRAPFLDYRLVDFVNRLPYEFKMKGLKTKYLLKKLMNDKLPQQIVQRKKHGFAVPVGKWLRGELKDLCDATLSEKNLKKHGLFKYETVRRLKEEHFSNMEDHRKLLWNILVFQLWFERWMK
ncbi:MAG: asparagine synthase (glutamine-hydrolyzing) [Minisyncoccia bacterium]